MALWPYLKTIITKNSNHRGKGHFMKKLFTVLALLCLVLTGSQAQKKFSVYGIAFYNQENLFDTCHDEGKNDVEFLPTGTYRWNGMKYTHKLRNMSRRTWHRCATRRGLRLHWLERGRKPQGARRADCPRASGQAWI